MGGLIAWIGMTSVLIGLIFTFPLGKWLEHDMPMALPPALTGGWDLWKWFSTLRIAGLSGLFCWIVDREYLLATLAGCFMAVVAISKSWQDVEDEIAPEAPDRRGRRRRS